MKLKNLNYYYHKIRPLKIGELSNFIEKLDNTFYNPIYSREYFISYSALSNKFINEGVIIYCKNNLNLLVGLVVFYANPQTFKYAYETYISVSPDYRGLGISKVLMQMEITYCKEIGMYGIMTNCEKKNIIKRNINFQMGYEEILNENEIQYFNRMNPKWENKDYFKIIL